MSSFRHLSILYSMRYLFTFCSGKGTHGVRQEYITLLFHSRQTNLTWAATREIKLGSKYFHMKGRHLMNSWKILKHQYRCTSSQRNADLPDSIWCWCLCLSCLIINTRFTKNGIDWFWIMSLSTIWMVSNLNMLFYNDIWHFCNIHVISEKN